MTITMEASGRADMLWGRGLDGLFPVISRRKDGTPERNPTAGVPWDPAGRRIDEDLYDQKLLDEALKNRKMVEVDPRNLYSNQSSVTLPGIKYYLSDEYARTGRTFADQNWATNRFPIVYHRRRNNQYVILTGNHRAAAALLQGKMLEAVLVEEPEGYGQHTGHYDAVPRRPARALRSGEGDLGEAGGGGHRGWQACGVARGGVEGSRGGAEDLRDQGPRGHRADRQVRQDGISALAQSYGDDVILRGLSWYLHEGKKGFELAKKLANHTITAQEIVREIEPLGIWWGLTEQYGGLDAYKSHAEANWDPVIPMLAETEGPEDWFGATCAVILVAKRPTVQTPNGPELWDPDKHNQPGTVYSGNSYLRSGFKLEIVEVNYDAGDGYHLLRGNGLKATANRLGDVAQAAKDAIDIAMGNWRPTKGMFALGSDHLDPRIFDGEHLKPAVRSTVLNALDAFWRPMFGDWTQWAKVYLAGSGASYWWDSDTDLDLMVGVDLDRLRQARPANIEVSDIEIVEHLNKTLMDLRPSMAATVFEPGTTPVDITYFVNEGSYDVRAIIPYAAYDVTDDAWVVKPPVLPADWGPDSIPDETWRRCEQMAEEARATLNLPEPERTIEGTILFDWIHEGRKAAYSAYGGGWLDPGNVIYQYLSQTPDHLLRRLYLCKHPEEVTAGDALEKTASVEGIEFRYVPDLPPEGRGIIGPGSAIFAYSGGEEIGGLSWFTQFIAGPMGHQAGQIEGVYVRDEFQRRGIATELLRRAREIDPRVHHSHSLTEDGKAWSQKTADKYDKVERKVTLGGTEFRLEFDPLRSPWWRTIGAYAGSREAGYLTWGFDNTIGDVGIQKPYQRKGLATAMLAFAREIGYDLKHSHALTPDGKAWSEKVASTRTAAMLFRGEVVDYKADRPLTGPDAKPITSVMPGTSMTPYEQVPFADDLDAAMGTDRNSDSLESYLAERKRWWRSQPTTQISLHTPFVVTQANINQKRVRELMDHPERGSSAPIWMVRYGGKIYVMNGHHRLVSEFLKGEPSIAAAVVDGERLRVQKAAMGYDLDQDGDEDVIGPLGQRWNGYSPLTRQRITNVVEDVQAGRRKPEPKERALSGYYSVDLDGRSEPERLLFAPVKGQWDAVMFLKQHQYAEAERVLPGWQQSADFRRYFGAKESPMSLSAKATGHLPGGIPARVAGQPEEPKDIRLVLIHKTDPNEAFKHLQQHLDTIPAEDKTGAVYPVQRKTVGEWDKNLMHSLTKTHGFSMHDHVGDAPTQGFMVSVDKDSEETVPLMDVTPQRVADYMSVHQQSLKDPNNYLGGWVHKGQTYLDISRWVPDRDQALKLAKANKQLGIYDLSSGNTVMTNEAA